MRTGFDGRDSQTAGDGDPSGPRLTVSGPTTLLVHSCQVFTVGRVDEGGEPLSDLEAAVGLSLSGSLVCYTAADCHGSSTDNVTLAAGVSAADFTCRGSAVGAVIMTATTDGLEPAIHHLQVNAPTLVVEKVYPLTGAGWLDFVAVDDANLGPLGQPDIACPTTPARFDQCLQGGTKLRVTVPILTDCAGLALVDNLDAFEWSCQTAGNGIVFTTTDPRFEVGLRDLVTVSGWRPNHVVLSENGTNLAISAALVWWPEPVMAAPGAGATSLVVLSDPGIHVRDGSTTGCGYQLEGAKVALVTLGGSVLYRDGSPGVCGGAQAAIGLVGLRFGWLEVGVSGGSQATSTVALEQTDMSVVYNTVAVGGNTNNAYVFESDANRFLNMSLSVSLGRNLHVNNSDGNLFAGLSAKDPDTEAIVLESSDDNELRQVRSAAGPSTGITLLNSSFNRLFDLRLAHNGQAGLQIDGGERNRVIGAVVYDSLTYGYACANSADNVLVQAIITSANDITTFGDVCPGLTINHSSLGLGTNGLIHTITHVPAIHQVVLAATAAVANDWFVGAATSDSNPDSTNGQHDLGVSGITVWLNFDFPQRTWGHETLGACVAGICQIWDWRLDAASDRLNDVPSGVAPAFLPQTTCPAVVHGDVVSSDNRTPPSQFLTNAIEQVADGRGNDNGLCESHEACLYAPNIGAYQGHGALAEPCLFEDGVVSGVTMRGYAENGVP